VHIGIPGGHMGLKLIGAGLGRTGTLSTKLALEKLGLGPCYHMIELFMNPSHAALWVQAARGHADWEGIFGSYPSSVDYPGCTFWRELAEFYPDAKMLLTVREPDLWFESTQATIFSPQHLERTTSGPLKEFVSSTILRDLGERIHDRDFMIDYYRRHNEAVARTIPPERLLIYRAAEGWEPLCAFLGVGIPDAPFPRANTREQFANAGAQLARDEREPPDMASYARERLALLREQS
jgi:hypothetical protein